MAIKHYKMYMLYNLSWQVLKGNLFESRFNVTKF